MGAIVSRWEDFWFRAVPVRRVALLRIAIAGFCAVELAFFARFLPRYGGVDAQFAEPMLLTRWLLDLPEAAVLGIYLVAIAALALATVGWRTRPSLFVGAAGYTFLYALFNSFHKINHGKVTLVLALWVLAIAPAGAAYSLDARRRRAAGRGEDRGEETSPLAGWAMRMVGMSLVVAYVLSAVAKVHVSGFEWITLPVIEIALMDRPESFLRNVMLDHPATLVASQVGLLVIEVLAVLLLKGGRARDVMVAVLITFHLTALWLLNVEFLGYIVCFLAFYRLEDGVDRVRAMVSGRSTGPVPGAVGSPGGSVGGA